MSYLSVCMIVKNEEKYLRDCLDSINEIADEIIVVDTGSTDKTKEIAVEFGGKIFDFAWNGNFSSARNFSISKAKGDWILCIDADEVISKADCLKLKETISVSEANAFYLVWRDYTNDSSVSNWKSSLGDRYKESSKAQGFVEFKVLRLFENNRGFEFAGKIHETIQDSVIENKGKMFVSDVVMHHYGDLKPAGEIRKKKELYEKLLKEIVSEDRERGEKERYFILYELAIELLNEDKISEAKKALEESLVLNPNYAKTLSRLGAIYLYEKNYARAEELLRMAVEIDATDSSAFANLGVVYSDKGDFAAASRELEKAIRINPLSADNFYNLGLVYAKMGKQEEAVKCFRKAIELNPSFKERVRIT